MANAVIEWPEGNEYLSGGRMEAQQCGSTSQGRLRWLVRLSARKEENSGDRGGSCRADRQKAMRAAEEEKNQAERIPQPAVAPARQQNH